MSTATPLSGLTATVTLPPGITAQIYDCQLEEEFREGDSESFTDAGYGSGVLTGQRLKGTIVGWLSQNDPGLGTMHSQAPMVFTAADGCVISGNFNVTGFRLRLRVGQVSVFTAEVASVGPYTKMWILS